MRGRWGAAMTMAGALVLPVSAVAGGWATVQLSATPDGVRAGERWSPQLEILQHGRTPLDGLRPKVTITNAATAASRTFAARPAGRTGTYRAAVVFPEPGTWKYTIDDGFSQRHSYPAVRIAGGPVRAQAAVPATTGGGDGGSSTPSALTAALVAGLVAATLTVAVRRRRRPRTRAARSAPTSTSPSGTTPAPH